MTRSPVLPCLLLVLAWVGPLGAAELAGVSLPDSIEVEGRTLQLNGLGLREATFLKVDVYVAGLYVAETTSDAQAILDSSEPSRIHMEFVRKVKREDIVEAWEEGFEKNADAGALAGLRERLSRFNGWMTSVVAGDTMTFTRLPGEGVRVTVGGEEQGTVEGDDFGRTLWAIWLGPEPPNAGLKRGMLGG